jgi:hypothetical protein
MSFVPLESVSNLSTPSNQSENQNPSLYNFTQKSQQIVSPGITPPPLNKENQSTSVITAGEGGKRGNLFAKPSPLGEIICGECEDEIEEEEAREACSRVFSKMFQEGGSNSVLSSLSLNLLNSLTEGKSGITSFGFNTPSPDDTVQNARMNKDSDLFPKSPIVKAQPTASATFGKEPVSASRSQLTAGLSSGNLWVPASMLPN